MDTLSSKKILIVEDEYSNYYLLKKIVESEGASTMWVNNGQDAVNYCSKNEDIDLVLMDLKLPLMNGLDATRRIKELHPSKPVIAVTAYAMKSDRNKALEAGCDEYISKPLKKAQLLRLISRFV